MNRLQIDGLGKNFLTEESRRNGVEAYSFMIRLYALRVRVEETCFIVCLPAHAVDLPRGGEATDGDVVPQRTVGRRTSVSEEVGGEVKTAATGVQARDAVGGGAELRVAEEATGGASSGEQEEGLRSRRAHRSREEARDVSRRVT